MPAGKARLRAPELLSPEHQGVWWSGVKEGYDYGYHAMQVGISRPPADAPGDLAKDARQAWWMGFRTAHEVGYRDWANGTPFTEPPAIPEQVWPDEEEEDGA